MADNVKILPSPDGSAVPIATDACTVNGVAGVQVPLTKLGFGANDAFSYVTTTAGLPVAVVGTVTVAGTVEVTNDVGNPLPVSGAVTANSQQAGDVIQIGGASYAVKRAFANLTASGNTQVVAAVAGKKIRVLSWAINSDAAVSFFFRSATAGAICSTKPLGAGGGMGRSLAHFGHFETAIGEALQVNLSAPANAGADLLYVEV